MKANKKLPDEASDRAKDAVEGDGKAEPEVEIDRSDEDALEALRSMGPVNTETATVDELAERVAYLEKLLDVHGEGGGPLR